MKKGFFALALMASVHCMAAVPGQVVWKNYRGFVSPGISGIVIGDFDGDGQKEAAVTGFAMPDIYQGDQLIDVLDSHSPQTGIGEITAFPFRFSRMILAPKENGADRLLAWMDSGNGGALVVLGGAPLRILRTIPSRSLTPMAVADVDGDGALEVIGTTSAYSGISFGNPVVVDYATGAEEWVDVNESATSVAVAQLDADPQLEIVFDSSQGLVLDGATHAVDWNYVDGFSGRIAVGNFDNDPATTEFAVGMWGKLQVFRSNPYALLNYFDAGQVSVLKARDINGDGVDDLAVGNGLSVSVLDPRTGGVLQTFANPYASQMTDIDIGNIDADAAPELVYGPGDSDGSLRVVDLGTQQAQYAQASVLGPYSATVLADFDGTGVQAGAFLELNYGTYPPRSTLNILNLQTGKVARSRANLMQTNDDERRLLIAALQADNDAPVEIAVASSTFPHGAAAVINSLSMQDQWRVEGPGTPLENNMVIAMATGDMNADAKADVILSTGTSPELSSLITVLNGTNGSLLWQTTVLTPQGETYATPTLALRNIDADAQKEILYTVSNVMYVYDSATRAIQGSIAAGFSIKDQTSWGSGSGCRIGLHDFVGSMHVYRCSDLAFERSITLPDSTDFLRPLDNAGTRFAVAADGVLYDMDANGRARALTPYLGQYLGYRNLGSWLDGTTPTRKTLLIGSATMVTRIDIDTDVLFDNGFE